MEYIAIAKNIKITPRKMRLVVDSVKKKNISSALITLAAMNKRAAVPIKKAIDSAVANAANNFNADKKGLRIKDITVTEGVSMKRYHYAARGRMRPYKRRTSHVRVVLADLSAAVKTDSKVVKVDEESLEKSKKTKEVKNGTKS